MQKVVVFLIRWKWGKQDLQNLSMLSFNGQINQCTFVFEYFWGDCLLSLNEFCQPLRITSPAVPLEHGYKVTLMAIFNPYRSLIRCLLLYVTPFATLNVMLLWPPTSLEILGLDIWLRRLRMRSRGGIHMSSLTQLVLLCSIYDRRLCVLLNLAGVLFGTFLPGACYWKNIVHSKDLGLIGSAEGPRISLGWLLRKMFMRDLLLSVVKSCTTWWSRK